MCKAEDKCVRPKTNGSLEDMTKTKLDQHEVNMNPTCVDPFGVRRLTSFNKAKGINNFRCIRTKLPLAEIEVSFECNSKIRGKRGIV